MKRASWWILLLPVLWAVSVPSSFALDTGTPAPPFVNLDLNQQRVWSRDYLGKGWTILDFFATDCEVCRKELPILERLHRELASRGLAVLVFATDPGGEAVVRPHFQNNPTSLPILLDNYRSAAKRYEVMEIPSLFVVDPRGIVVHKEVGFQDGLYERLRALFPDSAP